MCHEWWLRLMYDQREASRELWDEFEQTEPLNDPVVSDDDAEVTLERRDAPKVVAER